MSRGYRRPRRRGLTSAYLGSAGFGWARLGSADTGPASELEQRPGGAQVVRRRAAGPQFSLMPPRNGGPMVTRHKNADMTTNLAVRARRDTDSADQSRGLVLPSTVVGRQ